MSIYDNAVNKLINKGMKKDKAQKIITKTFQKRGIFRRGTQKFTEYGMSRNLLTELERKLQRRAKAERRPKRHYKIVGGKIKIKNLYKRKK